MFFVNNVKYKNPYKIVFLCGSFYQENKSDKRLILKNFLKEKLSDCYPIILEENFFFKTNNVQYLAYDDIILKDLHVIEDLTAAYADKIFVIHESLSTAAEFGMFVTNEQINKKLCLIEADSESINNSKKSTFMDLAFFNKNSNNVSKKIKYYPDVTLYKRSVEEIEYRVFFHDNTIGEYLGKEILKFVNIEEKQKIIKIKRNKFKKIQQNDDIEYFIDAKKKELSIYVSTEILKFHILALMLCNSTIRKSCRETRKIYEHANILGEEYIGTLFNTIITLAGKSIAEYKPKVFVKNSLNKLNSCIGYWLYLLQAMKLIMLEAPNKAIPSERKIVYSTELLDQETFFQKFIGDISAYGGIGV